MSAQQNARQAIEKTLAYIADKIEEALCGPYKNIRLYCDWTNARDIMEEAAKRACVDIDNLDTAPADTDWEKLVSDMRQKLWEDYREARIYDSEPGCNSNGNMSDSVAWYLSCSMDN